MLVSQQGFQLCRGFNALLTWGSAMHGITIRVIEVNGVLTGVSASDRHNLSMLGLTGMRDDRNGKAIKAARRYLAREFGSDFTLTKVRGVRSVALPTSVEIAALGSALALAA